jgi:hypothetical protein
MSAHVAAFWALFLTAAALAQGDRPALFVDGRSDELVTVHGRGRWVQDPGLVRIGVAALRVTGVATEKFPGFSLSKIPTRNALALVLHVFLEGTEPKSYRILLDDDQKGGDKDDHAIEYRTINPGLNEVVIPLRDRKADQGRAMKLDVMVWRLQFTKKFDPADPAIVLDGVTLRGGDPAADRRVFLERLAAEPQPAKQHVVLRDLGTLADADLANVALDLLSRDTAPRLRRAAREALARVSTPAVALEVADGALTRAAQFRPEILWAVASMPCQEARRRALSWVRDGRDAKITAPEKVAVLTGLRLGAGADVRAIVDAIPPAAAWPLRAALVRALRAAPEAESVDSLIAILAEPGSVRVAQDAEAALGGMTGGDYGSDAATWRDWWRVNRDKVTIGNRTASKTATYGKSTFYGLSVPEGRVAFVIDTSGSMAEPVGGGKLADYMKNAGHLSPTGIKTRLDLAVAELTHAVRNMKDKSSVGVISFSSAEVWHTKGFETMTQELRAKIGQRVHALSSGSSTNVYSGLNAAFHPNKKPRPQDLLEGPDTIFLLTDGNPSSGRYVEIADLRDEVLSWNLSRSIRINCVNVGNANANLLRDLAYGTGGAYVDLKSDIRPEDPK